MNGEGRTRWAVVFAAFGAGVIGATHIGKVPAALPAMRADLALDLVTAGWVVSLLYAIGMVLGAAAGLLSDRLGHRRMVLLGMAILASGSVAGALAETSGAILASRFAEGIGYIIAIVSAPSILARAAAPADRRLAVGMWGAFMPTGMGAMLVLSPFLQESVGWRGSWLALAALTLLWMGLMAVVLRSRAQAGEPSSESPEPAWRNFIIMVSARGPWVLALCFGFYTLAWIALMVWLPTFIVEQRGLSVRFAALLTVIAVLINLPGNLLGGWLSHKAVPRGAVIALAGALIALSGPLIFLDLLPDWARFGACLAYSFAVGVVPALIFGAVPYFAPGRGQIATTNGLVVQGSHLGQFTGPPLAALAVTLTGGWQAGALVFGFCGLGVMAFAALIHGEEKRLTSPQGSSERSTP
ncbi:MAG: MFS transporter [Alphaproteobacteria bacterium]|nr:MFS transporter [Alphaproteobacteria bacterium]